MFVLPSLPLVFLLPVFRAVPTLRSTFVEAFDFERGFQDHCERKVLSLCGTTSEISVKPWSKHGTIMKVIQSRFISFYYHFPYLAKIIISHNFFFPTYPASCPVHPEPKTQIVLKDLCLGQFWVIAYLVLGCSKTELLCWQVLLVLLSY